MEILTDVDPNNWGYQEDHFLSVFICVHLWLDVRQVLRSNPRWRVLAGDYVVNEVGIPP